VKLRAYEEAIQEAADAGLLISYVKDTVDDRGGLDLPPVVTERWSILQAVFFASTVLTTIGNPIDPITFTDYQVILNFKLSLFIARQ